MQAMKEELDQIVKNETWELVPRPKDNNVVGTKWVFKDRWMNKVRLWEIKKDWYEKDIHSKKA